MSKLINKQKEHMEKMLALLFLVFSMSLLLGEELRDFLYGRPVSPSQSLPIKDCIPNSNHRRKTKKWKRYSSLFILLKHKWSLSSADRLDATRQIKEVLPDTTIVMLTVRDDDEKLFEALKNGAQGYLLKEICSQEMLAMLRGAMQGDAALSASLAGRVLSEFRRLGAHGMGDKEDGSGLTEREQQVLLKVSQGATDKEIAISRRYHVGGHAFGRNQTTLPAVV